MRRQLTLLTVIHVCHSTPTGLAELPLLVAGKSVSPESGLGSNLTSSEPLNPRLIFAGAGFSKEEVEEMRQIEALRTLPWLVAIPKGASPPPMQQIVIRVKAALATHGFVPRGALEKSGGEGEVWEC